MPKAYVIMPRRKPKPCGRCGSTLNRAGKCTDETCPFSDHLQKCPAGWRGHPEHASGECVCVNSYEAQLKVGLKITIHLHTTARMAIAKNIATLAVMNALRHAEYDGFDDGLDDDAAISVEDVEVIAIEEL